MTVEVENLTKIYVSGQNTKVRAVDDVSFTAQEGKLFTLLGPSGCGKTTTLRCLAGLEDIDGGTIKIGGDIVSTGEKSVRPENRDIGLVFQSYALWPHMTAAENINYALNARDWPRNEREDRIQEVLELVNLPDVGDRYPSELSGGQQQRIAFARAISYEPSVLLMDEPLSNLDFKRRRSMRQSLLEILDEVGITTIYVTHDQEEAFEISDETLVLTDGKKAQKGTPEALYQEPTSPFVADFLGEANLFPQVETTHVDKDNQIARCVLEEGDTQIEMTCNYRDESVLQNPVVVVRPEDIQVRARTDGSTVQNEMNSWRAHVDQQLYRGSFTQNLLDIGDFRLKAKTDKPILNKGSTVPVSIDPEDATLVLGHR